MSVVAVTRGVIGRPGRTNLLCSPNAERGALRSSNFQLINFFFALLAGYYHSLLYRDMRPLLASPPPPYSAAAARHRRTPPSSPLPHPPPPPLPQHATAVTPESFAYVVRVCCTPRRLCCRPFAYRAAVIHRGRCSPGRQIPFSLNHVRSARPITWTRSWRLRGRCFVRRGWTMPGEGDADEYRIKDIVQKKVRSIILMMVNRVRILTREETSCATLASPTRSTT